MVITQQRQRPTNLQVVLRIGWSFPLLFLVGSSLHGQETREETIDPPGADLLRPQPHAYNIII